MPWQEPDDYKPMPGLATYLRGLTPKMNTAEMDMVLYWQWTHASPPGWTKTPAKAWADLNVPPARARDAIGKRIVPMEIYALVLKRAKESSKFKARRVRRKTARR